MLANAVFSTLASRYGWLTPLTAEGTYDVSDICFDLLDDILTENTGRNVEIIFCDTQKRVVEDGTLSYRTKGINNNIEDRELVPEDNLIGRYLGLRIPWGGSIALFMQTTYGLIVFVFLPFVLLVVFDLIHRRRNEKRQTDDVAALMAELEALKASNADVSDAPVAESCLPAADDSDSHDDAILPSEATSGDGIKLAGTHSKKPTRKPNFPGKREE